MDVYKKNRWLFWLMLFLIILNLSALFAYFAFRQEEPASPETTQAKPAEIFREELALSPEQTEKVEEINNNYNSMALPVADSIRKTRAHILNELSQSNPDTGKLYNLASQMAQLQNLMQRASIRQYLDLKSVVTPEQALKLSALYHELYGSPMKKKNMQHRFRGGRFKSSPSF
jgi:Spy/CpxP family protein refolding chaperone